MPVSLLQGIAVQLLLATSLLTTTTAVDVLRRGNVAPGKSIVAAIQNAHDAGTGIQPRFNFFAKLAGSTTEYEVHVREAVPAVTSETTISFQGGKSNTVNEDNVANMLVGDEPGVIVLIAVKKKGGKVNGIVQKKDGKKMKFKQNVGEGKVSIE
jgi:hypothetical protein